MILPIYNWYYTPTTILSLYYDNILPTIKMTQPPLSNMLPYQYNKILNNKPMQTKPQSNAPLTTTQNKYCRYPATLLQRYHNTMIIPYNQQTIAKNSIPRPESTEAHSWRIRSKDAHALGTEGGTPRPASRPDMPCYVIWPRHNMQCYLLCFTVNAIYAICVIRYPPGRRP